MSTKLTTIAKTGLNNAFVYVVSFAGFVNAAVITNAGCVFQRVMVPQLRAQANGDAADDDTMIGKESAQGRAAHGAARERAARGVGAPPATEPGCGAEPHMRFDG